MHTPPPHWDIFCRVIDNFGDIGVSWRLARILATDHQQSVRLWVDDLGTLARLEPALSTALARQVYPDINPSIEIIHWAGPQPDILPAPYVIEAFGCDLPATYRALMSGRTVAWFNLEYFSAEPWVLNCHGLHSPQSDHADKQFVFPSTLPHTGGLLREANLLQERQTFIHDAAERARWSQQWRVPLPTPTAPSSKGLTILLFGYENEALAPLINLLNTLEDQPVILYLPEGRLLASARAALNRPDLVAGDTLHQGNITLHILPFLPQAQFDRLLWLCDLNFVRGEDSLVRALWAGKPLVWQIYPTEDDAHWAKLDALLDSLGLDSFNQGLSPAARHAWRRINHAWNQQTLAPDDWHAFMATLPELSQYAEHTSSRLAQQTELADWLVKTAFERLQCATN